jgi:hypothetical protein
MDEGDPFRWRNYGAIASAIPRKRSRIARGTMTARRRIGRDRSFIPRRDVLLPLCGNAATEIGRGDARIATPFGGDVKYGKRVQRDRLLLGAGWRDFRHSSVINAAL